jgi:hypothetical protein
MAASHAHPDPGGAAAASPDASREAADESLARDHPRYCPTELLASFTLLMAGHGRCVHADMMLGDREYAMWQLACAQGIDDAELAEVTARLFAYFDDPQHSGMAVVGTA